VSEVGVGTLGCLLEPGLGSVWILVRVTVEAARDLNEDFGDLVGVWWIVSHTLNPDH
jgi:hypothetical protein